MAPMALMGFDALGALLLGRPSVPPLGDLSRRFRTRAEYYPELVRSAQCIDKPEGIVVNEY